MHYIAVHGGAGQHGRTSKDQVKNALKRACTEALRMASESPSTSALSIVERAISILEDDDCLNAGYGSNLTFEGTVECDAAVMDGHTGDFGSIGAVSGVQNPIRLAHAVLSEGRVPDRLGRIRPLTLVADGARAFAERCAIETVDPMSMVSPRARQEWQRWRAQFDAGTPEQLETPMQDTVGAVAWDGEGRLAAGVSSGGLLLKHTGRIGEAAVFGAGCWAEESRDGQAMACSISGAGEHIIRTGLARNIADTIRSSSDNEEVDVHNLLTGILSTRFHDPIIARGDNPNAGVLLMTKELQESGKAIPRLWCAFTTESMAVAYASSQELTPKAKILRRPTASQVVIARNTSPVYITALPLHE